VSSFAWVSQYAISEYFIHWHFIIESMNINTTRIGHKIKKLRELRNFTQSFMADKLEISQGAYSRMELGESEITYGKLTKISEVLEIPLDEIISFHENMIFNVSHNQTGNGYVVNKGISDKQEKLYQDQIDLLKSQNEYLQRLLEKFINS
jgi:transcriptional regulator with XRE-family HTH domain